MNFAQLRSPAHACRLRPRCAASLSGQRSRTDTGFLGARFWGQVRGSSRRLKVLQGKGGTSAETSQIAGKARYQAPFPGHKAAGRILHGKEAVPGSSPGEGLSTCKSATFEYCRAPLHQGGALGSSRPGSARRAKTPWKPQPRPTPRGTSVTRRFSSVSRGQKQRSQLSGCPARAPPSSPSAPAIAVLE
jgi:hypothetical protein